MPGRPLERLAACSPALSLAPPASAPTSSTVGVVDERGEHPRRVRTAADAGHHRVGQPADLVEALGLRLPADHRLKVADDHRKRVRADHAADRVMRGPRRAHPVAHRFVGRVAQGPRAGRHRHDRRPQRPHVEDVELLTPDVFFTHVDRALDAKQGAGRRRGDAVLASPGLGDHAGLVHPLRQHHLADGVVDLVRTGVVQILALQVDLGASGVFRQPLGVKQGRRAADVVLQITVQPRLKLGVGLGFS